MKQRKFYKSKERLKGGRHYDENRKVGGSIPDEVIGFFK
jgi:hypothetical protein